MHDRRLDQKRLLTPWSTFFQFTNEKPLMFKSQDVP